MIFWLLASVITLITLGILYFASGIRLADAGTPDTGAALNAHFKTHLFEIERDEDIGLLSASEAEAAKAELAREMVRLRSDTGDAEKASKTVPKAVFAFAALTIALASVGIYVTIGSPDISSTPLASREFPQSQEFNVAQAVEKVEALLEQNPDDARGWSVIGPIYMQMGRYNEATTAFRRVLELLPPSADAETDLAEAIMMANDGVAEGEPLALLESAAARDPAHIRSRFYLAGEATRLGEFENAISQWQALLALGTGNEPWLEVVRNGIRVAEAGLRGEPVTAPGEATPAIDGDQADLIRNMVEGLSQRLLESGGTIDEWVRLVRSRLVLGETEQAQAAYNAAKVAYPDATNRAELDNLAREAGLE